MWFSSFRRDQSSSVCVMPRDQTSATTPCPGKPRFPCACWCCFLLSCPVVSLMLLLLLWLLQEVEEMRTWVNERMEKEEKRRLAEEAREKRALAAAEQPRRRSGRLIVSFDGFGTWRRSMISLLYIICGENRNVSQDLIKVVWEPEGSLWFGELRVSILELIFVRYCCKRRAPPKKRKMHLRPCFSTSCYDRL